MLDPEIGLSIAEAAALLAAFDTTDQVAFSVLSFSRADPAIVDAAAAAVERGATGAERWAAVYVLANESTDAGPLLDAVTDADPAIRVMAATGLLARGETAGFDPLIAMIVDDSLAPGWPPVPVWEQAVTALVRYTAISDLGPPFDATTAQRTIALSNWQGWLGTHRDTLRFDPEVALWRTG